MLINVHINYKTAASEKATPIRMQVKTFYRKLESAIITNKFFEVFKSAELLKEIIFQ